MDAIVGDFFDGGIDVNQVLGIAEPLAVPLNLVDNNIRERRVIPKNGSYYEETIPRYDDILFGEHFRMSRAAFQTLTERIGQQRPNVVRNTVIQLEKKVLFTIWILSKQESFLACGDRFGLARSSAYYIFSEIITILVELLPQLIIWPHNHDTSIEIFHERSRGFPGVVGAIDGCHIRIKQPLDNAHDYYNRNNYHSIILQGTSNHTLKFIDIFLGLPGRIHDARVFKNNIFL